MAASEAPAIQVTLHCSDKLDEYDTRTLTLRPGSIIHIGRASKNPSKPELMVGPANAYVDSPTISREHAVLTATAPPSRRVYITDKGSMHGTMINGSKLEPQKAHGLSNGDVLQFGANVTRENLFYTSRSFTFESSLPSYPKGFSVPDDVETSDEEELAVNEAMHSSPRYGSESNPVTLDETDDSHSRGAQKAHPLVIDDDDDDDDDEFSDDGLNNDPQDTTLPLNPSEDTQDRLSSPDVEEPVFCPEDISTFSANERRVFADDESSDCGDIASSYVSEDDQIYNMGSPIDTGVSVVDSDESQSEGDMDLEYKFEEDDDVAAPTTLSRPSEIRPPPDWHSSELHRIFLEQQDKKRLLMAQSQQDSIQDAHKAPHQSMGSDHTAQVNNYDHKTNTGLDVAVPLQPYASASLDARKEEEPVLFSPNSQPATRAESYKLPEPPEPRMDHFFNPSGMFDDMVFGNMDSSIPPRPAAPRPMQWNMLDYNSPFSPPVATPSFQIPYHPDAFGRPIPTESLLPSPYAPQNPPMSTENVWVQAKPPTEVRASGVHTPPPAPSSEMSSPPACRTGVSIREIVEDTVQQPPTPTSVTGGLKRKADVLEEPIEESGSKPSPAPAPAPAQVAEAATETRTNVDVTTLAPHAVDAVDAPAKPTDIVEQRPKKRLRSRLGNAAKTAAAWTLPGVFVGAAASVAFLTSVPNDFFVA